MTDSTCLSGNTTTLNGADDVVLAFCACSFEGLVYDKLKCAKSEIIVDVTVVDGYVAAAGNDANSCYRALSSACTVEVRLSGCIIDSHLLSPPSEIKVR